jgi:hypothetical protein
MRIFSLAAAAVVVLLFSGCAAITTGTTQPLSVTTKQSGVAIVGASCELTNGKGTYYVITPGTVTVSRSFSDMIVVCRKDPLPDANMTVKSSVKGMAFGNILVGGLVGVIVDTSTGAAYDYPSSFELEMGKSVMIDARSIAKADDANAKTVDKAKVSAIPAGATTSANANTTVTPVAPVVAPVATPASVKTEVTK